MIVLSDLCVDLVSFLGVLLVILEDLCVGMVFVAGAMALLGVPLKPLAREVRAAFRKDPREED